MNEEKLLACMQKRPKFFSIFTHSSISEFAFITSLSDALL